MKKLDYNTLNEYQKLEILKRPAIDLDKIFPAVRSIISDVKMNGIDAALKYAKSFDGFTSQNFRVNEDEFDKAEFVLSSKTKKAIELAASNIRKFHEIQIPKINEIEIQPGIICKRKYTAIENVGLYIPGGSAPLPSTMLMLGIPADIAGCRRVSAFTPVKGNTVHPSILYAAKVAGVKDVFKLGGAQAIGLMAYGFEDFPKVDKIFGPGNQYVTAAKQLVSIDPEGAAIDMPAGPSELLIIADETANPKFVAADLLSQAEHGPDSQVLLITNDAQLASQVEDALAEQLSDLPRSSIAEKALKKSLILLVDSIDSALSFSNKYAPEHLILCTKNEDELSEKIINAGSVFIGNYSPESAGDYASGTNHSLPTSGYAKTFGGVAVESFMKTITFQKLSYAGLKSLSESIIELAETEGLSAHARAVSLRIENEN